MGNGCMGDAWCEIEGDCGGKGSRYQAVDVANGKAIGQCCWDPCEKICDVANGAAT